MCGADGEPLFLRAQSAHVLRILAARRGALVSREEIVGEVWRDLAVTDDSLTQCIADIRRTIGDRDREVLQTVPKRGFILWGTAAESATAPATAGESREGSGGILDATAHFTSPAEAFVSFNLEAPPSAANGDKSAARAGGRSVGRDQGTSTIAYDGIVPALTSALKLAAEQGTTIGIDTAAQATERSRELARLPRPGQVIASVAARDAAEADPDFEFEDLGDLALEVGRPPVRAFQVHHAGPSRLLRPQIDARDLLPTVTVIPLRPGDTSNPDRSLGIVFADAVTTALGRSEEINVTSRMSSMVFQGRASGLPEIGRLVGADFVLSGLFLQNDDRAVISVEFASVETQRVLWSERMETSVSDLLGSLDPAQEIVAKIRKAIVLNEIRQVRSRPLETLSNYSILFGAVGMMHRLSPSDFFLAGKLLEALIERAPNHPAPLAWLARWRVLRVVQGWSDEPQRESERALECTARALDLDPENTLALVSEGQVLTHLALRLDAAEDRFDLALEINPNDAHGRALRGMLYAFEDRGEEGRRDAERALHLAPLDPHRFFFLALAAGANLAAEDYGRAMTLAQASLRLNRTHTSTLRMLAAAQAGAGREEEARETVRELMRLQPNLRISTWLKSSPSRNYKIGQKVAEALRAAGLPE